MYEIIFLFGDLYGFFRWLVYKFGDSSLKFSNLSLHSVIVYWCSYICGDNSNTDFFWWFDLKFSISDDGGDDVLQVIVVVAWWL